MLLFIELAEGNEELAVDRHENLTQLCLSCLATMLNIPLEMDSGADGRRKVSLTVFHITEVSLYSAWIYIYFTLG
jgi:hypothetical protein